MKSHSPILLAIETSCDESAVAILTECDGRPTIQDALISSQIALHRPYGGVVPEVASRNHLTTLPPLVESLLARNKLSPSQCDGFAATGGPGLASSLLIGHAMAKGFAIATQKPFYSINHMEGHLLSPFIQHPNHHLPPHLSLIVSGGHTMLLDVRGIGDYRLISKTLDDAVGEAFDKVGRMLGLPYPGGPEIEQCALLGNPKAHHFPRSLPRKLDFSFSGLKTAVLYTLQNLGYTQEAPPTGEALADLCASFQAAVIATLVSKTLRAAKQTENTLVTLSGGVSCNQALSHALHTNLTAAGLDYLPCDPQYSTDNAAMIAYSAWFFHSQQSPSPLNLNINPNLPLTHS